ncbi:Ig-like domain-containing protein [Bifidobacterium saguinibicoloris]|uniref:Ig-like domain-containing protein n=1 Tax=Bifidobacterium saguinibicoloris TaxID=2834433 RepID=UPI001C584A9D|nr:tandem-95 repeat protein [Bifidobacterium saguinibicoloris]MBW3081424.1 tandem-95 repeat protein [Bifidobacterium saguinibicoloris]
MAKSSQAYERRRRIGALLRRLTPSGSRAWVTPVITLLLILAGIAGAIVISSVMQRHVQLDDGTVWVTSLKNRKAARFNVKLREADAAVASSAQRFDVAQNGSDTVLDEGGKSSAIKASTIAMAGSTETKGSMSVMMNGGTVAFIDTKTGDVWAGSSDDVESVAPSSAKPQMALGVGGRAVVTSDGAVWGYRPKDGMVLKLASPQDRNASDTESLTDGGRMNADSFTVVGDVPVIASGRQVLFSGGKTSTDVNGRLTLQSPSVDGVQSDWVAAAGSNGLTLIDLTKSGPEPLVLESGGKGEPARPVSSGGCVYAAWSQKANNYVRVCSADDGKASFSTLQSVNATSELVFRTNHRQVVLNDVVNGNVWNPRDSTNVIKIQWNRIQTERTKQQERNEDSADNQRDFAKTCSAQSGQIKAEDDEFGARAGSEQILDVLRNDHQTDCSVLRIDQVSAPSGGTVTVSPVYDGRYIQLDATKAEPGTVTFSYDISDGHGQTSTATVSLDILGTANQAPVQSDVPPELSVEQGATYTANAMGSFTDPDGDPLTLVSAVASNSDQVTVSTRADGQLVFNTGSLTSGRVGVEVTVSDGRLTGTGTVYFSVKPANTLPADIDPVVKSTLPDTDTTIDLKPYVHGTGAQPAQLSGADAPSGASVTMNAADMTIQFRATTPGTYYVPYTVTQGSIPATGLARVEVQPAAGESAKPVAANDVALLGADNTAIVEPLSNDIDPMGGVLSVTSVTADPASGIKTGLVSHKRVYLTARQVPTTPVEVSYTVANAAGTSTGTIVLQPPALATGNAAPKASNVNTQVRTGGIVSVDVLDHVSYSDGTTVTLSNDLQTDKATFRGLAFVSGTTVRYQASDEPGVYPITYTVKDNLGNAASGTITVTVHERNAEGKAAPTPHDTEAQVAAGQKVRIPITLTGIDVDGDDDQLLGLGNKAPQLGRITEVGANYMVYEAYADSSGTDTFSYAVEDWTGQRAQAQIRVGVFQGASDSGVYARDDSVTLRPDTAATVPVTLNDISGDNTDLKVDGKLETQGISGAKVEANAIAFTTPSTAGTAYIVYTVKDKAGLSDTGTLTVNVDPNAPIDPPQAYDYRVPSAATIDKRSVDVDVSQWIANPSGPADELQVGVHESARDHARVKGGAKSTVITVDLTDEARAVPYTVTNTKYHITSTAFIQVPAYGVFPPTLRPKAPALKVNARETIQINIADYVRVGAGKEPYVDGADSVSATKAADDDLYVNDKTLKFTAPKDYSGPASITFTAVDGKKGSDKTKIINSAVLTLPITVIGRDVPAPTFSSSTIDVVAGEDAKTIDLKALTHTPDGLYDDEKQYTYSGGSSSGKVEATVSGSGSLRVKADKDATPGTTVSVPVDIAYGKGTVHAGVTVRVIASTKPLARISDKTVKIKAGSTETVNLLQDAYNPFPDSPLTAVQCVSDDTAKLTVQCNSSGSIAITAASDIGASSNKVLVTVQDGTKSADRKVTGTITVSVIDKPDAPLLSPVDAKPQDAAVDLTWTPGSANGSPITDYEVAWGGPTNGSKSCGAVTTCKITGLANGQTYTFKVRARNEVGWSKDSNTTTGKPDKVPDAPGKVSLQGARNAVTITWEAPGSSDKSSFSAPTSYNVTLTGPGGWSKQETGVKATSKTFDVPDEVLNGGTGFNASVQAVNDVGAGAAATGSLDSGVYGKPDDLTVTVTQNGDNVTGTVATGNMRGNACASITVTHGGSSSKVPCGNKSFSFAIKDNEYFSTFQVDAAMTTDKGITVNGSGKTDVSTNIGTVSTTIGNDGGGTCTLSWRSSGKVNGAKVRFGDYSNDDDQANRKDLKTTIGPWETCPTATVTPTFNGHDGESSTAPNGYVYRKKPTIDPNALRLSWNRDNHNRIDVFGTNGIDNYGRDDITSYTLVVDGQPVTGFNKLSTSIDASGIPAEADAGDITWKLTVTIESETYSTDISGTVSGIRADAAESQSLSGNLPESFYVEHPWVRGLASSIPR